MPWSSAEDEAGDDDWDNEAVPALSSESIHCSSNALACSSTELVRRGGSLEEMMMSSTHNLLRSQSLDLDNRLMIENETAFGCSLYPPR